MKRVKLEPSRDVLLEKMIWEWIRFMKVVDLAADDFDHHKKMAGQHIAKHRDALEYVW